MKTRNLLSAYRKLSLSHTEGRFFGGYLLPVEILALRKDGNHPAKGDWALADYWKNIGKVKARHIYVIVAEQNKEKIGKGFGFIYDKQQEEKDRLAFKDASVKLAEALITYGRSFK